MHSLTQTETYVVNLTSTLPNSLFLLSAGGSEPGHQLLRIRDAALVLAVLPAGAEGADGRHEPPVRQLCGAHLVDRHLPPGPRAASAAAGGAGEGLGLESMSVLS